MRPHRASSRRYIDQIDPVKRRFASLFLLKVNPLLPELSLADYLPFRIDFDKNG
jgi:hypothetical protein